MNHEELIKEYRRIRKSQGLTQAQASEGVEVGPETIMSAETLRRVPSLKKFVEMCKRLGYILAIVPLPEDKFTIINNVFPPEPEPKEDHSNIDYDNWEYENTDNN